MTLCSRVEVHRGSVLLERLQERGVREVLVRLQVRWVLALVRAALVRWDQSA